MNSERQPRTRRDLILEVWEKLSCQSIGAPELELIQKAIDDTFGAGAVESPASIARVLADAGAVLRHPELLDFDSDWRLRVEFAAYREISFASLGEAKKSIDRLDSMRRAFAEKEVGYSEHHHFNEFINEVRDDLRLIAKSESITERTRAEAREIAEWMSIWHRAPDLFPAWLELRLVSEEFMMLFPDFRPSRD
jgi:hypothetical protein